MNPANGNTHLPAAIGARIRAQRTAVGMKVSRLASLLGVTRNTIANYETGKTEPSGTDLLKIAEAIGCSVMELLTGESTAPAPRFAFRAHRVLRQNPDITVVARKFLRAYSEIEEITETRLTPKIEQFSVDPEDPDLDRRIENTARATRRACKISEAGPERIVSVLEDLGVRSLFFRWSGKGKIDGLSVVHGDLKLVMLNEHPSVTAERIIFSAAHELGHLVMHPELFTQQPENTENERNCENEAQRFAGCLLVPSEELQHLWQAERLDHLPLEHALLILKRVFRVSIWCLYQRTLQMRLTDMKHPLLIDRVKRLMGVRGKAKMEDLEPEPLRREALQRSTRFERLVRSAFIQEKIGVAKVAEMFQITVDEAKVCTARWLRPSNEDGSLN